MPSWDREPWWGRDLALTQSAGKLTARETSPRLAELEDFRRFGRIGYGGTYETPDATRILTLLWEDVESAAKNVAKAGIPRH